MDGTKALIHRRQQVRVGNVFIAYFFCLSTPIKILDEALRKEILFLKQCIKEKSLCPINQSVLGQKRSRICSLKKKCVLLISTYLQLYNIRVMYFFHQLKLNNCSLDSHLAYTNCAKIKETRLKSIQDSELMLFQGAFSTCFFKIDFSKWLFQNGSFKMACFFEI